jgi:hypothetical protein
MLEKWGYATASGLPSLSVTVVSGQMKSGSMQKEAVRQLQLRTAETMIAFATDRNLRLGSLVER